MSFPPQSPGGGYGPPPPPSPPPTGGSYGSYPPPPDWPAPPPEPPGGGHSKRPRTVAIAVGAVVLVGAAIVGTVLGLKGSGSKDEPAAPKASASGTADGGGAGAAAGQDGSGLVPYAVLSPGQCFDHPGLSKGVKRITTRSCDTPHDGEVIANERLTGTFADSAALRSRVLTLCQADAKKRMESIPTDGRTYYYYVIYPSLKTYTQQEKDTISCALTLSNKQGGAKLTKPLP